MKAQMNPHRRLSSKAKFFLVGLLPLLLLLLLTTFPKSSSGEVGTAASYGSPFSPTACYGDDKTQFPSNGFFAAAGTEEMWNNGSACGMHYWVKCGGGPCAGQVIEVKIVDYAKTLGSRPSQEGSTMVLSETAFKAITTSNSTADSIHIEYFQRRCFINYKKWILSIFQKADWKFKLEQKVVYESWMPEVKDIKFKHGNGTWSFQFKIEVGFFIFKVKVKG